MVPPEHVSIAIGLGNERRGTGTLVSPDGLILTVNYLLIGAQSVIVSLTNGEQMPAEIVARDYPSGLGLLQISGKGYPYLDQISSQSCQLGQDVFNVASVGNEGRRADSGFISYIGPFDALWEFVLDRCLMTTAMNLGLGGGPLCNALGQLVGVSYLTTMDIGKSILAIPAEAFLDCRDELLRHGRRMSSPSQAWLGLLSYTIRDHVVIAGLMPGGPADKAGIKQGDVLIAVDGREISQRRALYDLLRTHKPGDRVEFRVLRDNRVQSVQIASTRPDDYYA
jgi:serine protease Do